MGTTNVVPKLQFSLQLSRGIQGSPHMSAEVYNVLNIGLGASMALVQQSSFSTIFMTTYAQRLSSLVCLWWTTIAFFYGIIWLHNTPRTFTRWWLVMLVPASSVLLLVHNTTLNMGQLNIDYNSSNKYFTHEEGANLEDAGVRKHNLPSDHIDWDIWLYICSLWISMGIVIDFVIFIIAFILSKLWHHNCSLLAFQGSLLQAVLENILQNQLCFVIVHNCGVRRIFPRKRCTNLTGCFFGSRWCRSNHLCWIKCHQPISPPSSSC